MSVFADRLVRYDDLIACKNAFIDTRSPGSDQKENFTIIGPGVAENPNQHVHISIPHGFNIGGARQPAGCLNSQHSHLTEEIFVVHSGTWAFYTGVDGKDAKVILNEGDIISIPMDIFRGFENVGDGVGYLYAVLGSDNPGRVLWAPQVFDMAKEYGLILLENGSLVDTTLNETIPDGVKPMAVTSQEQIAQHRVITDEELAQTVVKASNFNWNKRSYLSQFDGVYEAPLVGNLNAKTCIQTQLNWPHGFNISALKLQPDAQVAPHIRFEEEVIFVHQGSVTIDLGDEVLTLNQGDTFSVPIEHVRAYSNNSQTDCVLYITRRHDAPKDPQFV
ncbi:MULTISPECIES: cupin domain-containing protein [Pseudoalteromonas]|uniref:cupin domain-containing protein n=1 Tax=Pseudoalteromonas TaxID=53246 RepID=UPI000BBB858C|nr:MULTISPECIES: cupin domain-containing protein [Pseudoalteromonas]MDC9507984.1 cupin domain-containing protein [Pseudoalteromonas sp. Angola-4]|tara:strand:+ start:3536 stop:4534 length:999 start_codon:yes stop_codon:yes gene_type:complete